MNISQRQRRDAKIVRLYEDGIVCSRIAEVVKLKSARVRRILTSKGYDLDGRTAGRPTPVNSIWEQDRVDLRAAIAKRASEAARTRLNEINATGLTSVPSSQVIPTKIGYAHGAGHFAESKLAPQKRGELVRDRTNFPQAVS